MAGYRYFGLSYAHQYKTYEKVISIGGSIKFVQALGQLNFDSFSNGQFGYTGSGSRVKIMEVTGYGVGMDLSMSVSGRDYSFGVGLNNTDNIL